MRAALDPGSARPAEPPTRVLPQLAFARRVVFAVVVVGLLSRLSFLSLPRFQTGDEYNAYDASSAAGEAFLQGDASERWALLDRFSNGGRVGWILPHFALSGYAPGHGGAAWCIPAICGALTIFALASAAGNLFGERGALLAPWLSEPSRPSSSIIRRASSRPRPPPCGWPAPSPS